MYLYPAQPRRLPSNLSAINWTTTLANKRSFSSHRCSICAAVKGSEGSKRPRCTDWGSTIGSSVGEVGGGEYGGGSFWPPSSSLGASGVVCGDGLVAGVAVRFTFLRRKRTLNTIVWREFIGVREWDGEKFRVFCLRPWIVGSVRRK